MDPQNHSQSSTSARLAATLILRAMNSESHVKPNLSFSCTFAIFHVSLHEHCESPGAKPHRPPVPPSDIRHAWEISCSIEIHSFPRTSTSNCFCFFIGGCLWPS